MGTFPKDRSKKFVISTPDVSSQSFLSRFKERHKEYNPVDYALYEYFNTSFHTILDQQPQDFHDEVNHFKEISSKVQTFCDFVHRKIHKSPDADRQFFKDFTDKLNFPRTHWGDSFSVGAATCAQMMLNEDVFR